METQEQRANGKQATISFRVSSDLYKRFTKAAAADHRSIAGEVRYLIEQRVLEHEQAA